MCHYDPLGIFLNISLTNFEIITSKIIEITTCNKYDEIINDDELLLDIWKYLEHLSNYKDILPFNRSMIPSRYGMSCLAPTSIMTEASTQNLQPYKFYQ